MLAALRASLLLSAAAVLFGGSLVDAHRSASRMLEREAAALARLRAGEGSADGYRFERRTEGPGAALSLASPVEPGRDGMRWFATADGVDFYEFDSARHRAAAAGPDTRRLRAFLALAADRRTAARLPSGWRRLE